MKIQQFLLVGAVLGALVSCSEETKPKTASVSSPRAATTAFLKHPSTVSVRYPAVNEGAIQDTFFGKVVADPYRWLETSVSEDTALPVNKWVASQHNLAKNYLNALPEKQGIVKRLNELWNYERIGAPSQEGNFLYYFKNNGLQNQSVLYRQKGPKGKATVFLDPNKFSTDGTTSLSGTIYSKDGRYMAYLKSEAGSDWKTVEVMDCTSGKQLKDRIEGVRYSAISWQGDGFYYSKFDQLNAGDKFTEQNQFHQVYYHKIGTAQSTDVQVFTDRSKPKNLFNISTSSDEAVLCLSETESTSGNALYYKYAKDEVFTSIVKSFKNDFNVVDRVGQELYVYTNYKADKFQLIAINLDKPQASNWRTVIPEQKNATLNGVTIVGEHLVARYTMEITNKLAVYTLKGKYKGDVKLPKIIGRGVPVTLSQAVGKRTKNTAYFTMTSFVLPSLVCSFDIKSLEAKVWATPEVKFDPTAYEVEYTHYKSKDGTSIPISIIYKKGLKRNGKTPTLLYGYGGFNISVLPKFALGRLPLLEAGGVYAVANIRGGGELGKSWHKAGTQLQKQNVFDDFIAAAEYLIKEKYTSSAKLAIEGRSNGGLLVGACMTQRPDLYRVAFPIVGVLDMLRYHKFTIGHFWATDYGTSDQKEHFENLIKYSPVHNVRAVNYPATMVMTADHDDRVVPGHSFKFAAELQTKQTSSAPILLRVDRKAGHGAGKPTSMRIDEIADKIAFLLFNTQD